MVAPFVVAAGVALAAVVSVGSVVVPLTVWHIINTVGDKDDSSYIAYPPNNDVENGGFRVIIVNQAKSWDKAVRLYPDSDVEEWTEVRCGDSPTGKTARSNPDIKYDDKRLNFKDGKVAKLALMKPGGLGVWGTVGTISIPLEHREQFNGKTVYIYFDDNGDKFFAGETNPNRLTVDKLF